METENDFLFNTAKTLWESESTKTSTLYSTPELLKRLKHLNETNSKVKGYDIVVTVGLLKELVNRYNTNRLDKYRLQVISEISKVPGFIKPLIKLDTTI